MSRLFSSPTGHDTTGTGGGRALATFVGGWLSGRTATGSSRDLGRGTGARC
ncbi:MAG TPA: hypothetical protein VKG45_00095 [Actinomycetes bacterium]|nr:hypothetical protein [Actinomycetes bacterium]